MRLIHQLLTYSTRALAIAFLLVACESPQQSSTPPNTPPASSPPSNSPPPRPSQPSAPPTKQSPPSSQRPSSQPTSQETDKSSPPSSEQQETSREQARQQAAQTLQKAGAQVSQTAQQLPRSVGGEWDPLIPDGQNQSQPESETYEESESSPQAGGSSGIDFPADLAEDIQEARAALEQAGIAIQAAGAALENAETDTELAEAEKSLAEARVSVIVAGQDLINIHDIFEDMPQEDKIFDAEKALSEANNAIVIATDSVFDARIQLPDFGQPEATSASGSGEPGDQGEGEGEGEGQASYPDVRSGNSGSELDKALDDSIAIFEGKILDARNEALGSTPPPMSAENVPGVVVLASNRLEQGSGTFEENRNGSLDSGTPLAIESERILKSSELTKTSIETARILIPEDIPSEQGDDIVATQLVAAVNAQTDPILKKKLEVELEKYRAAIK